MKVGFTGTRKGMSNSQMMTLDRLLRNLYPTEFHHGDCIGADAEAHEIVRDVMKGQCKIVGHPCSIESQRAHMECDETKEPRHPLDRNQDIVYSCDVLVATPGKADEERRSGTWATVRRARKVGKPVFLITPEGETR